MVVVNGHVLKVVAVPGRGVLVRPGRHNKRLEFSADFKAGTLQIIGESPQEMLANAVRAGMTLQRESARIPQPVTVDANVSPVRLSGRVPFGPASGLRSAPFPGRSEPQ